MAMSDDRLRVLFSVRPPSETTNPYIVQLADAVGREVDVQFFGWGPALLGRYDVWHVHWPEVLVRRRGRLARTAALARFALLMARLTALRTPVVRTLHNTGAHETGSRLEQLLLRWCDRRTTYWIRLNDNTELPAGRRSTDSTVIAHGHYVDWFARHPHPEQVPGRVVNFGLIRPYKGTDALLAAFGGVDDRTATLRILGAPSTERLRAMVTAAERTDRRVSSLLRHVDDETLAVEIGRAQLVVLPYRDMHNSGALLLALSLGRPVLVPGNAVTRAVADEVGPGWVHTYSGPRLTAADLAAALRDSADRPAASRPQLAARDWAAVGHQHVQAYRTAASSARRPVPSAS
jgi:beta-1,4-mannosyltransferase